MQAADTAVGAVVVEEVAELATVIHEAEAHLLVGAHGDHPDIRPWDLDLDRHINEQYTSNKHFIFFHFSLHRFFFLPTNLKDLHWFTDIWYYIPKK